MRLLEERIRKDGKVLPGNVLKAGSFLNHLIDDSLLESIGGEIAALFRKDGITKILTVEASGIAVACYTARHLRVPVLFAKKRESSNVDGEVYSAEITSYTKKDRCRIFVEREFLLSSDRVLVLDDFLARGEAMRGLISLVRQAGAVLCGCAAAIEKGFQGGGDALRAEGVRVESLAIIDAMDENSVTFREI